MLPIAPKLRTSNKKGLMVDCSRWIGRQNSGLVAADGVLENMEGNKAVIYRAVFGVNFKILRRIGDADFMGQKSRVNATLHGNFVGFSNYDMIENFMEDREQLLLIIKETS